MSGIKAAVRAGAGRGKGNRLGRGGGGGGGGGGKGGGGGEDWDLDLEDGDGTEYMSGREELPVLVTLNLVSREVNVFLISVEGRLRSSADGSRYLGVRSSFSMRVFRKRQLARIEYICSSQVRVDRAG